MEIDRDAVFNRVFDLFRDPVQRYCLRRLPFDEVNDAVAEVFLVAWKRLDHLPADMELAWLYGIARNVVRNTSRTRRRRVGLQTVIASQPILDAPSAETQVLRQHEDREMLDALAGLRIDDREILRLKAWEQLSNPEIARVLGVSVGAVEMRITRARARLAESLNKRQSAAGSTVPVVEKRGER